MRKPYFIIILAILIGTCWAGAETVYTWDKLDQPFQQIIKIPLIGKAVVNVNIPETYLANNKTISLRMAISTPFVPGGIDRMVDSAFHYFSPAIIVNGKRFTGTHPFKYRFVEGERKSNAYVEIKTKKLRPGKNTLTFDAGKREDVSFSCGDDNINCTAIYVHRIWLEQ